MRIDFYRRKLLLKGMKTINDENEPSAGFEKGMRLVERLSRATKEHGYTGRWGIVKFAFRYCMGYVLLLLAMHLPPTSFINVLQRGRGVRIGKDVFIGEDVFIDAVYPEMVCIRDGASISARCTVLAHTRDLRNYKKGMSFRDCPFVVKRVTINEGAYIGMCSVILPGVCIGKGAVVGAGSVVTKDIPDYTIAVGVPAKVIRYISE